MPEADLEAQLTEYREEAEQKYNKETEDCTDVLSDIIDEMRQRLMNKLSDFSKLLKSEKEIEEKNKKLVQVYNFGRSPKICTKMAHHLNPNLVHILPPGCASSWYTYFGSS